MYNSAITQNVFVIANKNLKNHFSEFDDIMSIQGESFRRVKNRETLRFTLDNKAYFIKKHFGVGGKELLKNLLQFRLPIFSSKNEWLAIQKLQELNIQTMTLAGYGKYGINPIRQRSFVITEELQNIIGLRDICSKWQKQPLNFTLKKAIIEKLANITKKLHEHGIYHRDLYMAHFLLDKSSLKLDSAPKIKIYIIDLHRTRICKNAPKRWLLKELAALYFSAMPAKPTSKDILRFLSNYFAMPWQRIIKEYKSLLYKIEKRVLKLYRKSHEQFIKKQNWRRLFICDKKYYTPKMQSLLANPDAYLKQGELLKKDTTTCTVAKINLDNEQLVIKRYNIKNIYYLLTHLIQSSRATLCWNNSHFLQHYNISTPKPIAIIEKRFGPLRGKSYFISEYIPSMQINDFFLKEQNQQKLHIVAKKTIAILIKLRNKNIRFRDTKATNFLVAGNDTYLIDLDGMRKYSPIIYKLRKSFAKDKQRFMKNWRNYPDIEQLFLELYDKIT